MGLWNEVTLLFLILLTSVFWSWLVRSVQRGITRVGDRARWRFDSWCSPYKPAFFFGGGGLFHEIPCWREALPHGCLVRVAWYVANLKRSSSHLVLATAISCLSSVSIPVTGIKVHVVYCEGQGTELSHECCLALPDLIVQRQLPRPWGWENLCSSLFCAGVFSPTGMGHDLAHVQGWP